MLRGHVDGVTHSHVWGWAADTSAPDSTVQVSIFVDGRKVAQTECNTLREDLKSKGFGDGRHGFRYDFPNKLDESSNKRLAVRFADTGLPLGNGEVILSKGRVSSLPVPDPERAKELMRLPAPENQREFFDLLALLDPEYGIYQLIRRFDFEGWTAGQASIAAFGKLVDIEPGAAGQSSSDIADYFNDLLFSDEFQRSIIPSLLHAYADKRRLLFVHIPKCAGSDLSRNLRTRYPSLDQRVMEPEWTDKEELFKELREFVELTRFSDTICLRGHIGLDYYIKNELIRPSDSVFSIMRDPIEIALSAVNYVMTRIRRDFEQQRLDPDTKKWLNLLGIAAIPNQVNDDFAAQVCLKALYNQNIVIPNSMCHWLGGGNAQAVVERLAKQRVELTDTARYNSWLFDRWGISSATRQNESIKYMTVGTLKPAEREYLAEISGEDLKLYAALQRGLAASGRSSVTGHELLAG